jgi:hypothetical protein
MGVGQRRKSGERGEWIACVSSLLFSFSRESGPWAEEKTNAKVVFVR